MKSNTDIYEFILDNMKKIIVPEMLLKIEQSLSRFEFLALLLVERSGNITMTGLAQGMAVPMSTATGIVDRMVRKKLLKRERSEEDRRIVTVSLTDSGSTMVAEVKKHLLNIIETVRGLLTEEEFDAGMNLARKVIAGLQNTPGDICKDTVQPRRSIKIE